MAHEQQSIVVSGSTICRSLVKEEHLGKNSYLLDPRPGVILVQRQVHTRYGSVLMRKDLASSAGASLV